MAAIDAPAVSDLTPADISAALALSDKVGWNQTADDWRVFIARARTIGLFGSDRDLLATAAALPYERGFGWISMVIVDPAWRRRGLARQLMGECVDTLRRQGRAALLDATPAGALVYRHLGFNELCTLDRWEGEGGAAAAQAKGGDAVRLNRAMIDRLIAADADAFGATRHFLLQDILARDGASAWTCDGSYLVMRKGHRAMQIGPLIASSGDAAHSLLATAIAAARGRVFLDLLDPWRNLASLLEACGFARQRPFVRMALDRATLPGNPQLLAIAAGPEFG